MGRGGGVITMFCGAIKQGRYGILKVLLHRVIFFPLVLLRIREKEKAELCVSQALR